ncbi:hypothetical protein AABC03_13955 (plasmid) [Staphylococcus nepalensis]
MNQIVVGLVPSPGLPEKITYKIIDGLATHIKKGINREINLKFEIKTDPIIDSSEEINKAMNIANHIKENNDWDYIICLTDLPRFSNKKTIISDMNIYQKTALIFLPSLGAFNIKVKTHHIIIDVLNYLISNTLQHKIKNLRPLVYNQIYFQKLKK